MGNLPLTKELERKLCSFYGKFISNQSIGKETMQFYGKLTSD